MNERIHIKTWLIIAVIMIGVICIPVPAPMWHCQDLKAGSLSYPSTVNSGGEFTFTITVTNAGNAPISGGVIQVTLPGGIIITAGTIPPLREKPPKGVDKKEITCTVTIPPGVAIGNTPFTVTLIPSGSSECSLNNNEVSGTTFVLPKGMTQEEYESQTSPTFYKITGPPFVDPPSGGGGPPPPP